MVSLIRSALPLSSADIIDGIVRNATTDPALRQLLNGIVCAPLDITNGRKPKTDAPPANGSAATDTRPPAAVTDDDEDDGPPGLTLSDSGEDDMPGLEEASSGSSSSGNNGDADSDGPPGLDDDDSDSDGGQKARTGPSFPASRPAQPRRPAPRPRQTPEQRAAELRRRELEKQRAKEERRAARAKKRETQAAAEATKGRAERPEELFAQEEAERARLRQEKGLVEEPEESGAATVATCCRNQLVESLQADSKAFPKAAIKFDKLRCERHEGGDIEQNEHRLRIDCEKGCTYYMHQQCAQRLYTAGVHTTEQPWGKMGTKAQAQALSKQALEIECLLPGCPGRVRETTLEKEKGAKGQVDQWYHAKWHQDMLDAEKAKAKARFEELEEDRRRKQAEDKAAADAAAKAAAQKAREEEEALQKLSKNRRQKLDKEKRREAAIAAKRKPTDHAAAVAAVAPSLPGMSAAASRAAAAATAAAGARGGAGPSRPAAEEGPQETEAEKAARVAKIAQLRGDALRPMEKRKSEDGAAADAAAAAAAAKKEAKAARKRGKAAKKGQRLDVDFGPPPEAAQQDTLFYGSGPATIQERVERAVGNDPDLGGAPREARRSTSGAEARLPAAPPATMPVTEFPGLGRPDDSNDTSFGVRQLLEMLDCRNFVDSNLQPPATPFVLVDNLDASGLTQDRRFSPSQMLRHHFGNRTELEIFAEDGCAVVEVEPYGGAQAMSQVHGTTIGSRAVVASALVEFVDQPMALHLLGLVEHASGLDKRMLMKTEVQNFVDSQRAARGAPALPTLADLAAIRAATADSRGPPPEASAPPPPPPAPPAAGRGRGAPAGRAGGRGRGAAPPPQSGRGTAPMQATAPAFQPSRDSPYAPAEPRAAALVPPQPPAPRPVSSSGSAAATGSGVTTPTASAASTPVPPITSTTPARSSSQHSEPGHFSTFQEGLQWMRAAQPLAGAPPFWMDISTVYVLPLSQSNLRGNYVRMPTFALPATSFPNIRANAAYPCALMLFERETGLLYGVKRVDMVPGAPGQPERVKCFPIDAADPQLHVVDSSEPQVQRNMPAEALQRLPKPQTPAQVATGPNAWRLLHLWTPLYGDAVVRSWPELG